MTKVDKTLKDNWFDFGMSYLSLAELACEEMTTKSKPRHNIGDLYIAVVYNIKHGIEVGLKSLIVLLEEKEIAKKLEHHNQKEILDELYRLIRERKIIKLIGNLVEKNKENEAWIFKGKSQDHIMLTMFNMVTLVSKYHSCEFLKDKIGTDFIIEDTSNTAFKYPQNNLLVKLDYEKIIKKITKDDIEKIHTDVLKLMNCFLTLDIIFDECISIKEKTRELPAKRNTS